MLRQSWGPLKGGGGGRCDDGKGEGRGERESDGARLEGRREAPQAKECRRPPEAGKGGGVVSPLESLSRTSPASSLTLAQ